MILPPSSVFTLFLTMTCCPSTHQLRHVITPLLLLVDFFFSRPSLFSLSSTYIFILLVVLFYCHQFHHRRRYNGSSWARIASNEAQSSLSSSNEPHGFLLSLTMSSVNELKQCSIQSLWLN